MNEMPWPLLVWATMQCGRSPALFERRNDLIHVVAVDLGHVPTEGFELGGRSGAMLLVSVKRGALLEPVVVDDQRQVVQPELGGGR